jgi:hypothetical protein
MQQQEQLCGAGPGGPGSDVSPIFGPGLPNSGVYAGGGSGGGFCASTTPGTPGRWRIRWRKW